MPGVLELDGHKCRKTNCELLHSTCCAQVLVDYGRKELVSMANLNAAAEYWMPVNLPLALYEAG